MEETKPKHYKLTVTNYKGDSIQCDYFDIGNALDLSLEQFTALRYFRVKGDVNKQINDTQKAIECLNRHINQLNNYKESKPIKLF